MENTIDSVSADKVPYTYLLMLLCLSAAGYCWWIISGSTGVDLFQLLFVGLFNSAVLFLFYFYLCQSGKKITFFQLIGTAIVLRLLAVIGDPILEDDYFRYLLDGCVFVHYGSPYGISPESLFVDNQLPPICQDLLDSVNNPDYPTIYAPVLQYIFLLAYTISPANIDVLQVINLLFDLGIIFILTRWVSLDVVMLYAWNPLVIKEVVFTAHPDVIPVFFILLAGYLLIHKSYFFTAICLALALASKIFVLVLLPFILIKINWRYWVVFALALLVLYLPFLIKANTDISVLIQFAQNWSFNASFYYLFEYFFSKKTARYLLALLFAIGWVILFVQYMFDKKGLTPFFRADMVLGLLLAVSPVVNAWYLLWLLPFACLFSSLWIWVASVSMWFSYIIGLHLDQQHIGAYQQPWWGWTLVYFPIFTVIAWQLFRGTKLAWTDYSASGRPE